MAPSLLNSTTPLEVIFIPWYASSHLVPMAEIAALLSSRGVSSTILTTPANAPLIQPTIDHFSSSNHPIRTLLYPFPSSQSHLPPGAENISSVPSSESVKFDFACVHVRPALEPLILSNKPNIIVADIHFTWIFETARDIDVPFFTFTGSGLFPDVVIEVIKHDKPHHHLAPDDNTPVLLPGLPHDIYLAQSEVPDLFRRGYVPAIPTPDEIDNLWDKLDEMEERSFGRIVNGYAEIDSGYTDHFLKVRGKPSWSVGPVNVAVAAAMSGRPENGNENLAARAQGDSFCLSWLSTQKPRSVMYVCFGSYYSFKEIQIREIASGLESCSHPFLWVVRGDSVGFLPEGFEERVKLEGKGLVVRGWAPQTAILGHVAVGGFMTHCGWNSFLEGVAAGLPLVTWPLVFEQFINEKLIVDVLKIGVKCRRGVGSTFEDDKEVVRGEEVEAAVRRIMNEVEEAAAVRKRASEFGQKAKDAVKEGGSSYNRLTELIETMEALAEKKHN